MNYIKDFVFRKMWDRYDLEWHDLHKDVNILVGINGKGKTTLLDVMNSFYNDKFPATFFKKYGEDRIEATPLDCPVFYIQSSDIPAQVKKKGNSMLYERLLQVVLQNEQRDSFFNYRMRALNYPEESTRINQRVNLLFKEIDSYFKESDKHIVIERDSNMLVFKEGYDERTVTVFLMDEKPAVLLMDEPEVSLHIEWQERLIKSLRKLNKNCQLIVTTHSPSIFASGWENNITYIEDLYTDGK